jgi:hypothetical protein
MQLQLKTFIDNIHVNMGFQINKTGYYATVIGHTVVIGPLVKLPAPN